MNEEQKKQLKAKSYSLDPSIRIGKNGLSENTINEINKQLKNRKVIKIKMLSAFVEGQNKKVLVKEIVDKTEGELVHHVGFIVILARP